MAVSLRPTIGLAQIVQCVNGLRIAHVGSSFHLDASEVTVLAAAPTDLPSCLTVINQVSGVLLFHAFDTVCCKVVDPNRGNLPAPASALSLATALSNYGVLKTFWTAHIASTAVHYNADGTNGWTSATPTDLPSLITALTEARTKVNAHLASAPTTMGAALRVAQN